MIKLKKKEVQTEPFEEISVTENNVKTVEMPEQTSVKTGKVTRLPLKCEKNTNLPMLSLHEVSRETKKSNGWISPTYFSSRHVSIDTEIANKNRCVGLNHDSQESEGYRVLKSHILRHTGLDGGVTVMVTSALPGEGKTLTAINLSLSFAEEFMHTALLVDCDLKEQNVHQLLGYQSEKGLSDHLLDNLPLSELTVWPGVEKITIISGGRRIASGSPLLGSQRMKLLMEDVKNRYPERYVFLDSPPLLDGADALALIPLVDYVLVVVQAGKTSMDDVKKAINLIPQNKLLGIVLNRHNTNSLFSDVVLRNNCR